MGSVPCFANAIHVCYKFPVLYVCLPVSKFSSHNKRSLHGTLKLKVILSNLTAAWFSGAHRMAGLGAGGHGGGAGVGRQVLRRRHRHEAHAEVAAEGGQVTHLPHRGRGRILMTGTGGEGGKKRREEC